MESRKSAVLAFVCALGVAFAGPRASAGENDIRAPIDLWPTPGGTFALGWRLETQWIRFEGPVSGLQIGLGFLEEHPFRGVQISLLNHMEGTGLQIGVLNSSGAITGIQAGLFNLCTDRTSGLQIGAVNSGHRMEGFQIGVVNLSRILQGGQIGAVNYANEMSGFQVGVVNLARNSCFGVQIGLVNWTDSEKEDFGAMQLGGANIASQNEIACVPLCRISF